MIKIDKIHYQHVQGGHVPGGHYVIYNDGKKPFITPTREMNSIPLRYSDIVVDIGAYVGTYAIRCARFPVKKVIAYEPTLESFSILEKSYLPNMELYNAAVVHDNRLSVDLFISRGIGVTNSIVKDKGKIGAISVPAISYKDAVKNASIVKIDVEGAEYLFPIVQPTLRAIIIDFHPIGNDWIIRAEKIIQQLLDAGFKTVIQPDWSNGWTRAGSWIRDLETYGEFSPMLQGELCCGCGCKVNSTIKSKALCSDCYDNFWRPQHRKDYHRVEISVPDDIWET